MTKLSLVLPGTVCLTLLLVGAAKAQPPLIQEPSPPQKFLIQCANADHAEIQFAQLALKNAGSDEVKKFAQTMVDEHEKCRKDLLNHFKDLKTGVISILDKNDKETYDRLAALKGADFDREYMKSQVTRQQQAISFLQTNAKSTDPSVKEFAQKQIKSVQDHLKRAQEIQKNLK